MPIVVSYEDVGSLGTAALNAGFQSSFGQNYAQAAGQRRGQQHADTQMMMGNAFQRQNQNLQNKHDSQMQASGQEFQAGQAAQDRQMQGDQMQMRAQDQAQDNAHQQAQLQATYDMQRAREAEAAINDKRDFSNKILFEDLKNQYGEQEAARKMADKLKYESSLDAQKHQDARNRFAQAAVRSGNARSPEEGGLMFDHNIVEQAAKKARGGASGGKDLLGTLSGDVVQNAILAMKAGTPGAYMTDLEGKGSMRELPYNQRVASSAMVAAASDPNETSDAQVFRAIAEAQSTGNEALTQQLQQAYRDRVAFGKNVRSNATSGGPGVGRGGGAAPYQQYGQQPDPASMTDEELLMNLYGPQ